MTTDATSSTAEKPIRTRRAKTSVASTSPTAATAPAPAAKPLSKSDTVIKLLLRAKGATPAELIAATDWRPHSLRAFLSGLRKKGRIIVRDERKGGGFAYRVVAAAVEPANAAGSEEAKSVVAAEGSDAATAEA